MNSPDVIKIRIFGSHDCESCDKLFRSMRMHGIDYEFVDAFAADKEALCDLHHVDDLPHIQAYIDGSDDILFERLGYLSPIMLLQEISDALDEKRNPSEVTIRGVTSSPTATNKTKDKNEQGCSECGNAETESTTQ